MSKKLLVIDDALIIRAMIKDAAETAGWQIAGEASNGQEAVERYQQLDPDAVTLDLVMPDYDGLHALRGILEHDPDAKVLIVSALDQRNVLKDAINLGAADFIVKPFQKDCLTGALEKMVSSN